MAGPRPRPQPARVAYSLLVLEEVLRGLAVPHHPGPVLLQRLDVPGRAGVWVWVPSRACRHPTSQEPRPGQPERLPVAVMEG